MSRYIRNFSNGIKPEGLQMDALQTTVISLVSERQKALRLAEEIQAQLERYGVRLVDSPAGTAWQLKSLVSEEPAALKQG